MNGSSVARLSDPTFDPDNSDTLAIALVEQRAYVVHLESVVCEARDAVVRAGAELDASVRARDRAIWEFEQLDELATHSE